MKKTTIQDCRADVARAMQKFQTYLAARGIGIGSYRRVMSELDKRDPRTTWEFKVEDGTLRFYVRNVVAAEASDDRIGLEVWSEDGKTQLFAA